MSRILGVLGGMGPLATVDFLQKLIEETPARRDQEHVPVIAYSVPQMPERPPAIIGQGESPLPHMLDGIRTLKRAGATDHVARQTIRFDRLFTKAPRWHDAA